MFKHLTQWHEHHHPCHTWLGKLPDCHLLITNLYVGAIITVLVVFSPLHDISLIVALEDAAIDWVIYTQRHTELRQPETPHFVFLNLDEQTHQKWGEPLITPRDKLQRLIEFAVAGQPSVIIIDIDLTYPTHCITERTQCVHEHIQLNQADTDLRNFLENYGKSPCNGQSCPPLILVKTTQPILDEHEKPTLQRQFRPSFLDQTVFNNKSYLHWASTLFELEGNMAILRRWQWCEPNKTNQLDSLPSIQLLTAELLEPESTLSCADVKEADLSQRILYTLEPSSEHLAYPTALRADNTERPLLTNYPAHSIVERPDESDNAALKQSIAIIGSSYTESNDLYTTPLVTMPGAVVIVNAIHSLQQYGLLHKPAWYIAVAIEMFSLFIIGIAFTYFRKSFYGMSLSLLFVIIMMILLSFWLFKYGTWFDFVLPLIVLQVHRIHKTFEAFHQHPKEI